MDGSKPAGMGDCGVGALQMLSCVDSVTGRRRFSHYSWYRHKLASCHDIADLPTPVCWSPQGRSRW